jgi:hypothetical protein
MSKIKVELIGGPRDGAFAGISIDQNELVLHEKDAETNLQTGRHIVYKRKDAKRFFFDRSYLDGHIVDLVDGPLKGTKISVASVDACLVLRTMAEGLAVYAVSSLKDGKWAFFEEFPKGEEAKAENFARHLLANLKKGA